MDERLDDLYECILNGDIDDAPKLVQQGLDNGFEPGYILNDCMIAAMKEVGELFEEGEFYVPEMLVSALTMKSGLEVLRPHLVSTGIDPIGKVVMGTVQADMHDIGKNLVTMMMEGAGFEVTDLGIDVSPDKFIEAIKTIQPQVIGMSALLTTTMPNMKATIDALAAAGVRDQVKILVGGAPVTEAYAASIGADGYAADASQAAALAKSFVLAV